MLRSISLCRHAAANTPAEPWGAFVARFPHDGGLPRFDGGSASASGVSRPARRSLAFRPACSPNCPRQSFTSKCFSGFVTSSTAPIATGWSDPCRAGIAPAENRRLFTAHAKRAGHIVRATRAADFEDQVHPKSEEGDGAVLGLAAALARFRTHARRQMVQADGRFHLVAVLSPRSRPAKMTDVALGKYLLGAACRWVIVWFGHESWGPALLSWQDAGPFSPSARRGRQSPRR